MPGVAAVVLAALGGARLDHALASVAWAGERVVLDPAARLTGGLPPGVRHVVRPVALAALSECAWLLLVLEGETASPALAEAVPRVLADPTGRAWRLPLDVHALGTQWTPRRAPVRLALRTRAMLTVRDGRAELAAAGPSPGALDAGLVVEAPASLEAAVQALDAESAALAAWLHASAAPAHVRQLVLPPLLAAGRVLTARGRSTRPWARWVAAVLAGYRTLVVPAKVWELEQLAGVGAGPGRGRSAGRAEA